MLQIFFSFFSSFPRRPLLTFIFTCLLFLVSVSTRAQSDVFRVGIAKVGAGLPVGVPLAGYGTKDRRLQKEDKNTFHPFSHFFKPSTGIRDDILTKAMIIEKNNHRVLFLGLDVIAVSDDLREDVIDLLEPLGFKSDEIMISATHTHSGPGTLTRNFFWSLFAADLFQKRVYKNFLAQLKEAVIEAQNNIEEVNLYTSEHLTTGLQQNRRRHPGVYDPTARFLLAVSKKDGRWRGGLVNFAVHGTGLGPKNLEFSADVPGSIERALEDELSAQNKNNLSLNSHQDPQLIFINGAEGDVIPIDNNNTNLNDYGHTFVEQIRPALFPSHLTPLQGELSIRQTRISLGPPKWLWNKCSDEHISRNFMIDMFFKMIGFWFPKKANLWSIDIGSLHMMTWPGEPTTQVGQSLRTLAEQAGYREPWIMGLTNEHLGYFTMPQEWDEGGYETCVNFYGRNGTERLLQGYNSLMAR